MSAQRIVKHRSIPLIYVFSILSFGIYGIYWMISTKRDINSFGGDVPHSILLFVPFANIFWAYKYCDSLARKIERSNNTLLYFVVYLLVGFLLPIFAQGTLNKVAAWQRQQMEMQQQQQQAPSAA